MSIAREGVSRRYHLISFISDNNATRDYFIYLYLSDFFSSAVYTLFAFFEYIVVLTNMGYHMTAAIDFGNQYLVLDSNYGISIHE